MLLRLALVKSCSNFLDKTLIAEVDHHKYLK